MSSFQQARQLCSPSSGKWEYKMRMISEVFCKIIQIVPLMEHVFHLSTWLNSLILIPSQSMDLGEPGGLRLKGLGKNYPTTVIQYPTFSLRMWMAAVFSQASTFWPPCKALGRILRHCVEEESGCTIWGLLFHLLFPIVIWEKMK